MVQTGEIKIFWGFSGWTFTGPPRIPFENLALGRTPDQVCELFPRLFNLCTAAQKASLYEAFGRDLDAQLQARVEDERRRDHARLFQFVLPNLMGFARSREEFEWPVPEADKFKTFLEESEALPARLWRTVAAWPGAKGACKVPSVQSDNVWAENSVVADNSLAALLENHPALSWIDETYGRGSAAWRLAGRWLDAAALSNHENLVPGPVAARGRMFTKIRVAGGMVSYFKRLTPTDFLVMENGVLEQMLATIDHRDPDIKTLVEIASPCVPYRVKGDERTNA